MDLTKEQRKELREALMDAFPDETDLERMLDDELDWKLNRITRAKSYENIVFKIIDYAEAQGKSKALWEAAKKVNPWNPKLSNFINRHFSSITPYDIYDLKAILNKIQFQKINFSYRETLPKGSEQDNVELSKVKNINEIIQKLAEDYPKDENEIPNVINLAKRIIGQLDKNSQEYQELKNWIETISSKLNIDISIESTSQLNSIEFKEHLFLIITPENKQLRVEAKYTQNGSLKNLDYFQETNTSNAQVNSNFSKGILCSSQDLSEKLGIIIQYFISNITSNFIIEIYLPYQHLYKSGDNDWCIKDDFNKKLPIVKDYHIVLHSTDRLKSKGISLKRLEETWNQLKYILDERPTSNIIQEQFKIINKTQKLNWDEIENELLREKKIGVKLTKFLEKSSDQENFIRTIINGGLPLAFWIKCPSSTKRRLEQIDCYLTVECLENNLKVLLEEICSFRSSAYLEKEPSKHLGYHLGFLCDDPETIKKLRLKPLRL